MFIFNPNSFSKRVIEYLLYVLVASFPFLVYSSFVYGGTATRSINIEIVTIVAAVLIGVGLIRKTISFQNVYSPVTIILAAYFLALILSTIVGVDSYTSFWSKLTRTTGLYFMTHLAVLYFVLVSLMSEEKVRNRLINLFIYASALYSVLVFLSVQGLGVLFVSYAKDGFTFQNSSFAAMHLVAAVALLLYQTKTSGWNLKKAGLFIALIINPLFLSNKLWFGEVASFTSLIGEAKASTVALLFMLGLYVVGSIIPLIKKQTIKKYTVVLATLISVGMLAFISGSLISENGIVRQYYLSQASAARPIVWGLSFKSIAERPLLGWGMDNFDRAYEKHFDSRVLEADYGNEAWFDRAHTPLIDQAVDGGYVGVTIYVLVFLVVLASMVFVIVRSNERRFIALSSLVGVYVLVHFLELQTAFDTSISALSFVIMMGLGTVAYHHHKGATYSSVPKIAHYVIGIIFVGYFLWSFFAGVVPTVIAQTTNGHLRSVGSSEKRLPLYNQLLRSPIDTGTMLWRTSTDLQRGILEDPRILEDKKNAGYLKKEFDLIIDRYKEYVGQKPNDFRSLLNVADLLLYMSLFGEDNINEARSYIDAAKALSPNNPMPYWMEAVSYVYQGKLKEARRVIDIAKQINPNAVGTHDVEKYIEQTTKSFPEIEMYFFKQI